MQIEGVERELARNVSRGVRPDPGVVNAYGALAVKHHFDKIDTIDIMDVNAGDHGKYFATNFDPEINFREFKKVWTWINRRWVEEKVHSIKMEYDFPVVGVQFHPESILTEHGKRILQNFVERG